MSCICLAAENESLRQAAEQAERAVLSVEADERRVMHAMVFLYVILVGLCFRSFYCVLCDCKYLLSCHDVNDCCRQN